MEGMRHESQRLWQAGGSRRDLSRRDHSLDPAREPPLGAHLVTPRRGYTHHGIYVGRGRVVQYGGLSHGLRRAPVEEVALLQFARGRPIWFRLEEPRQFDRDEVVHRARARLGEDRYNVLTNNCEHFCEWCVRGEPRSHQVDGLFAGCCRARRGLVALLVRSLFPWRTSARLSGD
jgi:hypothetical protein